MDLKEWSVAVFSATKPVPGVRVMSAPNQRTKYNKEDA